MNQSVKLAIEKTEPTTKAARLRQVMPEIEDKLASGVQLESIHKVLSAAGFDMTIQTFRTYIYRFRKKQKPLAVFGNDDLTSNSKAQSAAISSELVARRSSETAVSQQPISMREIDRLMKPDPAQQAEKIARYERLAKQQRRIRK